MGLLDKLLGRGRDGAATTPSRSPSTTAPSPTESTPRENGAPSAFDPLRGDRLLGTDRLDEAEAYFRRHLEGNARAHYGLGLVYARRDTASLTIERIAESARLFLHAIDLDPTFADAHLLCGTMQGALAAKHLAVYEKDPTLRSRLEDGEALLASAGVHLQRAAEIEPTLTKMAVVQARRLQALAATAARLRAGTA